MCNDSTMRRGLQGQPEYNTPTGEKSQKFYLLLCSVGSLGTQGFRKNARHFLAFSPLLSFNITLRYLKDQSKDMTKIEAS